MTVSLWDRFWPKVLVGDGCWIWTGAKTSGYGRTSIGYRSLRAHRVSYEWLIGPIPVGLTLDHLCRVHACVNPFHLEPVSNRENVLRSPTGLTAVNARKTHCIRGHPFNEENTYWRLEHPGRRECKACLRARDRNRKAVTEEGEKP